MGEIQIEHFKRTRAEGRMQKLVNHPARRENKGHEQSRTFGQGSQRPRSLRDPGPQMDVVLSCVPNGFLLLVNRCTMDQKLRGGRIHKLSNRGGTSFNTIVKLMFDFLITGGVRR